MKKGFSLIELMVCVIIITVLTGLAMPYYFNAVQTTRNTEAVIWWNQVKRMASRQNMTAERAARYERRVNEEGKLKYFTLKLFCRIKPGNEPCWEGELHVKNPSQHIQYFLATQNNFMTLTCVPTNDAGESFCQGWTGRDEGPDTEIEGRPAYTVHF